MGDALNVAVEEIEDPRVYSKNLTRPRSRLAARWSVISRSGTPRRASRRRSSSSSRDHPRRSWRRTSTKIGLLSRNWPGDQRASKRAKPPTPTTVKKALAVVNAADRQGRPDFAPQHQRPQRRRQVPEVAARPARHDPDACPQPDPGGSRKSPRCQPGRATLFHERVTSSASARPRPNRTARL